MKSILKRVVCGSTVIGILYFTLFDTTPRGTECERSTSPNGLYVAERCVLRWLPRGDSKYVGRLFDAKSGRKLAQHTFSTPVPDLSWYLGMDYSPKDDGVLIHAPPSVGFSIGDGGDDATFISLPPSTWDKLWAARPHL
jgi:hypothetical protein